MPMEIEKREKFRKRYKDLPSLPGRPIEIADVSLENEEWRLVQPIYFDVDENRYTVSSFGRVKDLLTNEFVRVIPDGRGYVSVVLSAKLKPGKSKYSIIKVHRLVMVHFKFVPECYAYDVDHKNEVKTDNHIWNLEWVTTKENKRRSQLNGTSRVIKSTRLLSDNEAYNLFVEMYKFNFGMSKFNTFDDILEKFGVTEEYANYLFSGRIKPHITAIFHNNILHNQIYSV